ncbi:MAG: methyltransferase domain-containing protein [Rhizobiales bacterium]|nr:methyltransferase domain-containing protein [Hyphomicrobiales bacterium]
MTGTGIEFGAGTMPVAVPLNCKVAFADFLPEMELRARAYAAQGSDFVELSYITGMEQMDGIADASLDFIIAAHVIEHTRNPLRAIKNAYEKLRKEGHLVLFVPDMRLTFDKLREVTPLEHLIADYESPSSERDVLHYVEFFSRAFITPIESLYQRVRDAIATNHDLHFHTWTYESFQNMVSYCRQSISPWSDVWSHPAAEQDKDANEFYFVLRK